MHADDRANDRCPRCGALVRPAAQWCTLCYADLRPAYAPFTAVETAPEAPPLEFGSDVPKTALASEAFDPLTAPLALLERSAEPTTDAGTSSPTAVEAPEPEPGAVSATWPCSRCHAAVALEEPTCPECGAPFMVSDASTGRLRELTASPGTKVAIMIGGSVAFGIVFFAVLFIIAALG